MIAGRCAAALVFAAGLAAAACSVSMPVPVAPPASQAPATTTMAPQATPSPGPAPSVRFELAFPGLPALERPVVMRELPGEGRMLVALQEGRVLSFALGSPGAVATVLDHTPRTSRDSNEEGLLGLALDPAFTSNRFVYLYYSAEGGARRTLLSRLTGTGSGAAFVLDPASELVILEVPQPFPNHKGGALEFGPDGMLYLGLGDGGSAGDPRGNGQDLANNLLGSIIRIDVRGMAPGSPYAIPADNPFASSGGGARRETWAYGLRNPWRFSFDRETGTLIAGDVGQNAVEEVDIIKPGGNYGWNVMEGSECFRPPSGCSRSGLELPLAEYRHDGGHCSVTGGYVYRGADITSLAGWYVYGDFCTGRVWAVRPLPGSGPVVLRNSGPAIASFAEDAAGELYILSFDGRIYRLAPG